jgi:hypothetical protein
VAVDRLVNYERVPTIDSKIAPAQVAGDVERALLADHGDQRRAAAMAARMLHTNRPLQEKMALLAQTHFATA